MSIELTFNCCDNCDYSCWKGNQHTQLICGLDKGDVDEDYCCDDFECEE